MKKFVLVVSYESGRVSMLTDTPDLTTALQQFNSKLKVVYDKIYPLIERKLSTLGDR